MSTRSLRSDMARDELRRIAAPHYYVAKDDE